jgi:ferredoxin-NADP reductase
MIKELVDSRRILDVLLLFSNHSTEFPFRAELEAWQKIYPTFKTVFVVTDEVGRFTSKRIRAYLESNGVEPLTPRYYIAGSPQMVQSCEHHLYDVGIEKGHIKTDSFEGYESYKGESHVYF